MAHFRGNLHASRTRFDAGIAGGRNLDAPQEYIPTQREIADLAYSYWEARGRSGGSAEEDWFRAESELKMRAARQRTV